MSAENMLAEWKEMLAVCNKFVNREITPYALDADQHRETEFVRESLRKLFRMEMLGILVPETFGGTGLGPLAASFMLDALSSGCASVATALAYHFAAQTALIEKGSDAQRKRWLEASTGAGDAETALGTCIFPLPDPPSREDTEVLALEKGGKDLVLDGNAGLVAGADLASFFTVFVRSRGDLFEDPITALILPADREGIEIGEKEEFGGLKALPIQPVIFDKLRIDPEDIIGNIKKADNLLGETQHLLHAFLAAIAMGVGRSAYEKAFDYARERYQYGKIIAHHQEIQRMLGKMLTSLHAGTALYIQALCGEPLDGICSDPRGDHAKVFCTNASLEIVLDAVQIHGGYGYMQDYGVEKLMRDAKMLQLLEGRNPVLQIEAARCEVEKSDR